MVVSVVYGGTAEEKGPSEKNARDIAGALETRGYSVNLMKFDRNIVNKLEQNGTDIVYLCVQGKGFGDGTFQGILEQEGIPFTGSGMRSACLINDKILCKLMFDRYGINTPKWDILTKKQYLSGDYPYEDLGYPFVAKAPTQGGSFGIELIEGKEDLPLIENVFKFDDPILLERFIKGNFYTVGFYESGDHLVTLPVVEGLDLRDNKTNKDGLISFTGSYGIRKSSLDGSLATEITEMAKKVFEVTWARGLARVDFMVSDDEKKPYVLEINAVPGLKRKSLMPQAAAQAGIVYEDMIEDILKAAVKDSGLVSTHCN